jgi:hypothetical protein
LCRYKIGARFAPNLPLAQKSLWTQSVVVLGDESQVEARFSHLEIVVILEQDRCMVFTKRSIGSEIVFDAPDGTPR